MSLHVGRHEEQQDLGDQEHGQLHGVEKVSAHEGDGAFNACYPGDEHDPKWTTHERGADRAGDRWVRWLCARSGGQSSKGGEEMAVHVCGSALLFAWQSTCYRRTGAGAGRVGVMQVPAKGRTSEGRDSTFWNPRIQSQRQRCRVCCTHVSCRRLHVRKVNAATRIGLHGIVAACEHFPWVISRGRHPSMGHHSPPYYTITVVLSDKLLVLSLPNAERAYHIAGALSSFLKNHRGATFRESPPPCSATCK